MCIETEKTVVVGENVSTSQGESVNHVFGTGKAMNQFVVPVYPLRIRGKVGNEMREQRIQTWSDSSLVVAMGVLKRGLTFPVKLRKK